MSIDLEHLAALHEAATPGPWYDSIGLQITENDEPLPIACWDCCNRVNHEKREDNIRFIVAARNALPELIERVRGAEREWSRAVETARKLMVECRDLRQRALDAEQAEREMSLENGRLLASQREHLVAAGIDPAELLIPLATPPNGTGYTSGYVQRLRAERDAAEARLAALEDGIKALAERIDLGEPTALMMTRDGLSEEDEDES